MEYTPPPLFKQGPSARVRLVFFVALSVGLLFADARFGAMEVVRKVVGTVLYPVQKVASLPVEWGRAGIDYISTLDTLQSENKELIREQIQDKQKLHELETVKQENEKLRKLMNVGNTLQVKRSILSEIVSDARDPFSRKIIIGKGLIQGVKEGMPVIDELGLLGQVTRAFPSRAEVSLITDKEQIIPVESLRNGLRSVAYGGLDGGLIELRFMAANADIENNDLLVTSGLDGVYPRGIPVARVIRVERNSRYAFASIFCEPIAGVERHRFVLVLDTFRDTTSSNVENAPTTEGEAPAENAPTTAPPAAAATTAPSTALPLPSNNLRAGNGN
ncbi:rod shape-determining protein MreC [Limnobacter parvus]|uniref:Cell shape-determining protein MreC n=1 Tax=Limnobacter parvus TaxID=2939690 RepID=A0ABT1XLG4_9BURK|nr:rod shape-determining protein MreC [Limnobacter parvus]MCR2747092.1 rod shape-determining protein MreC [Limnobacter parvus]